MDLNKTITWINKTEGRDKFCKAIQYGSRFLKYNLSNNKELSARFNGLFTYMRDARKMFRLFKSLNEFQKILEFLNKGSSDSVDHILNLLNRAAFFLYWVFDNIAILSTIKFLSKDPKTYNKYGAFFWFWALAFSIIQTLRKLVDNHQRISYEEADLIKASNSESEKLQNKIKKLKGEKTVHILNLVKNLGDLITASQGSEIFPKLTKRNFTEGWIGAGGFVSAVITSYQLY